MSIFHCKSKELLMTNNQRKETNMKVTINQYGGGFLFERDLTTYTKVTLFLSQVSEEAH